MELKYIPLAVKDIEKVPDRFNITLAGVDLIFEVAWNDAEGAFFASCYDAMENPMIEGRILIHHENFFEGILDERAPNVRIVPLDLTGAAEAGGITLEQVKNGIVKLYVLEVV
ncbi:MAG TPA: hypothetical protein VHY08_11670 [Bacillota bacterium]|nr:hypothetical protein [Bacillota bacterium]